MCSAVRMGAPDILLIRLRSNGGGEPITIIGDCDVNQIISGKGELRLFISIGRNHSASVRYNAKTAKAAPGMMKNEHVAFRTVDALQSTALRQFIGRTEERRVGKEGVSKCRSRWSPDH